MELTFRGPCSVERQVGDPIDRVRKLLVDKGFADQLKAIEENIKSDVQMIILECSAVPELELSMLQTNLYMQPNGIKMRGSKSDQWIAPTVKPNVKPGSN